MSWPAEDVSSLSWSVRCNIPPLLSVTEAVQLQAEDSAIT